MELKHLYNFVAIAEERSFTRAAERLWVAQPGLSAQIRRLEAELGVRLFERHARGVDLTDAGELFLDRARVALTAAEDARATGRDLAAGVVGSLRVGVSMSARSSLTQRLLETFTRERPQVEVTVVEAYGGVVVRDLGDRRLDAAVVPAAFATPELRRQPLPTEPLVVAVGLAHRLAGPGPLMIGELDGEELIVTGHRDGAAYDSAVAGVLNAAGVSLSERRGGHASNLLGPIVDGDALAVTTVPSVDRSDVLVRELHPSPTIPFELLWRADTPSPPLAELIRIAANVAQSGPRGGQGLVVAAA
jgi:DNA-binding transcriptional LysR family regulator